MMQQLVDFPRKKDKRLFFHYVKPHEDITIVKIYSGFQLKTSHEQLCDEHIQKNEPAYTLITFLTIQKS